MESIWLQSTPYLHAFAPEQLSHLAALEYWRVLFGERGTTQMAIFQKIKSNNQKDLRPTQPN